MVYLGFELLFFFFDGVQFANVDVEDCYGILSAEWWVVHTNMNSRFECFIKNANPVGREEKDAAVVFQNPKKDYNEVRTIKLMQK